MYLGPALDAIATFNERERRRPQQYFSNVQRKFEEIMAAIESARVPNIIALCTKAAMIYSAVLA
jgi:hypothetical protein